MSLRTRLCEHPEIIKILTDYHGLGEWLQDPERNFSDLLHMDANAFVGLATRDRIRKLMPLEAVRCHENEEFRMMMSTADLHRDHRAIRDKSYRVRRFVACLHRQNDIEIAWAYTDESSAVRMEAYYDAVAKSDAVLMSRLINDKDRTIRNRVQRWLAQTKKSNNG